MWWQLHYTPVRSSLCTAAKSTDPLAPAQLALLSVFPPCVPYRRAHHWKFIHFKPGEDSIIPKASNSRLRNVCFQSQWGTGHHQPLGCKTKPENWAGIPKGKFPFQFLQNPSDLPLFFLFFPSLFFPNPRNFRPDISSAEPLNQLHTQNLLLNTAEYFLPNILQPFH